MSVRISFARNAARKLIASSEVFTAPISILKIAEKCNLEVFEYTKFPDSISALIESNKKIILINPKHSETRQRFSIAHEIGHYILGHFEDEIDYEIDNEEEAITDHLKIVHSAEKEIEANEFAAELLMPLRLVKSSYANEHEPKKLAKIFNVSEAAMWIRLSNLRLIKYHQS